MSVALQINDNQNRLPPVSWRAPKMVSPVKLQQYIQTLEKACLEDPSSADLRTCLGMAQALNDDLYKSMETLEKAIYLDDSHFFARMRYAELLYRLSNLSRAETETLKAVNLAHNGWEFSMANKQLQEIRRLIRQGAKKPEWPAPLTVPAVSLLVALSILFGVMLLR